MGIMLSNFQDAARFIEAQVAGFEERARQILEREIEELKEDIGRRFQGTVESDFAWHLKIEHDGDSITLYLPFDIGTDSKGRRKVSARGKHNPGNPKFTYQPFQEALRDRGYTEIDPAPGQGIPETDGKTAPNVRISAKLPDKLIREIEETL
jgi:hypothetical protein